jgi:hypothetical protein
MILLLSVPGDAPKCGHDFITAGLPARLDEGVADTMVSVAR